MERRARPDGTRRPRLTARRFAVFVVLLALCGLAYLLVGRPPGEGGDVRSRGSEAGGALPDGPIPRLRGVDRARGERPAGTLAPAADRRVEARRLHLRVTSREEPPRAVVGAELVLVTAAGTPSIPLDEREVLRTTTDAEGRAALVLPSVEDAGDAGNASRRHHLRIAAPGHASARVLVPAPLPEDPLEVRLAAGAVLEGVVVTADGTPVPGVPVVARRVGALGPVDPRMGGEDPPHTRRVVTDGRGGFRLKDLEASAYEVRVDDPRWKPQDRDGGLLGAGRRYASSVFTAGCAPALRLVVERILAYRVRFVDARTGNPITCAGMVHATHARGAVRPLRMASAGDSILPRVPGLRFGRDPTDPSVFTGAVVLRTIDPPEYAQVNYIAPGYAFQSATVRLRNAPDLASDPSPDVVSLEPLGGDRGAIRVSVSLPEGVALLEGPGVLALAGGGGVLHGGAAIGPDAWHYDGIPTSTREVLVHGMERTVPVAVETGKTTALHLDLTRAPGMVLRVLDTDGKEVHGADVFVKSDKGGPAFTATGILSCARLDAQGAPLRHPLFLEPGRYVVEASLPDGRSLASKAIEVPPDALIDVDIHLRPPP